MTDPTQQPPAPQAAPPLTPAEDKQWASFAHFGGFLWILPSLIIYLVFKDRGALTRQESKEALNWQITFLIGYFALVIVIAILSAALIFTPAAGIISILGFLPFLAYVYNVIVSIMGGVKVNSGGSYRYPFAIRLVK